MQHLIPYYAEIFLASTLSHRLECSSAVLGGGSVAGSQYDMAGTQLQFIGVSMRPRRKPDLGAALKCFHLRCQSNLDPPVISEF